MFEPLYDTQVEALAHDIAVSPKPAVYRGADVLKMLKTDNVRLKVVAGHSVERNDLCPCGSGKKFKRCCK
jgi:uncharacterized protein YecA (UPF0149 family)